MPELVEAFMRQPTRIRHPKREVAKDKHFVLFLVFCFCISCAQNCVISLPFTITFFSRAVLEVNGLRIVWNPAQPKPKPVFETQPKSIRAICNPTQPNRSFWNQTRSSPTQTQFLKSSQGIFRNLSFWNSRKFSTRIFEDYL